MLYICGVLAKNYLMETFSKLTAFISRKQNLVFIFVIFALLASLQGLLLHKYNNYTIFEKSFYHLKTYQDLYVLYPSEQWDLYKYTPTFSVFFGIFHTLPDWLGLSLWNVLNALALLYAIYYLPKFTDTQKGLALIIVLIELMTSMQNAQANALMAGLMIFSFGLMEKDKPFLATLSLVLSIFIKLFSVVCFVLFLFYPKKWKIALYALFWTLVLSLLPLLFVDFPQYLALHQSYLNLLANDHDISYGYSVMGWLHTWFSLDVNKNMVVLLGACVFLLPFAKIKQYKNLSFRYLMLYSLLLWVIIFNHKAESPTFVIAMSAVALWFLQADKNKLNIFLFISAFVLTSLSPTDIFPQYLREEFVKPYCLKAVPCIFIWFRIMYDSFRQIRKQA